MTVVVLKKATALCPYCPAHFHQISDTEDHALSVVREALAKHVSADHPSEEE